MLNSVKDLMSTRYTNKIDIRSNNIYMVKLNILDNLTVEQLLSKSGYWEVL